MDVLRTFLFGSDGRFPLTSDLLLLLSLHLFILSHDPLCFKIGSIQKQLNPLDHLVGSALRFSVSMWGITRARESSLSSSDPAGCSYEWYSAYPGWTTAALEIWLREEERVSTLVCMKSWFWLFFFLITLAFSRTPKSC